MNDRESENHSRVSASYMNNQIQDFILQVGITLNILTSHRGNSIWGSVRRSVSATTNGNLEWKHLYFSYNAQRSTDELDGKRK